MSCVRNVVLLLSILLLCLNLCLPQRSERENPSELTDRHENVKENQDTAEKSQADKKRGNEEGIGAKAELVRFGSQLFVTGE